MESDNHDELTGQPPAPQRRYRGAQTSHVRRLANVFLDLTLLGVVIGAVVLFLNPFARWVDPPLVGADLTLGQVLAYRSGAGLLGAALLFAALAAILLRLRWRVTHSSLAQRQCPRCSSTALRRTKRSGFQHLLGLGGIPLYRFMCSDCRWQGLRAFKW
jgi:hypothetical protein